MTNEGTAERSGGVICGWRGEVNLKSKSGEGIQSGYIMRSGPV